jgi:monoamine oxidase
VLLFNSDRHEFHGLFMGYHECEVPGVTDAEWRDVTEAWERFHALSRALVTGHPVAGDQNQRLDSDTFARWIEENTQTDFGRWYFAYMSRAVGFMGPAEPNQVSLLHVLWGQKCAPQSEHPEAELIHGGAGQVPEKIAAELGDQIRLNEPVLCIHHNETGVEIETAKNRFAAQFTIVATPPHLAGQIRYDPPLPPLRQQLTQRIPMGCLMKILVSYETPFWREKGLAGMGIGNRPWIELCADSSDPESGKGVIATFVVFHFVCLAWIFFRAEDFEVARLYLAGFAAGWTGGRAAQFLLSKKELSISLRRGCGHRDHPHCVLRDGHGEKL